MQMFYIILKKTTNEKVKAWIPDGCEEWQRFYNFFRIRLEFISGKEFFFFFHVQILSSWSKQDIVSNLRNWNCIKFKT